MTKLTPIKQKRISDQIFEQIRDLIYRGELSPGSKLMPEREMAVTMGVSRASVRNAIKRLAAVGLVEQQQGRGTFVASHDASTAFLFADAADPGNPDIKDLLEVRMGLECYAAALAAVRADENDIRAMAKSTAQMAQALDAGRPGSRADASFHMAIALAAKNPLHTVIINSFSTYLFHGEQDLLHQLYGKNPNSVLKQHEDIIRQIKNREPDKAHLAMKAHILYLSDYVKAARERSL